MVLPHIAERERIRKFERTLLKIEFHNRLHISASDLERILALMEEKKKEREMLVRNLTEREREAEIAAAIEKNETLRG